MEKVQTATKTCPLCKATPFVGFINKYFERQLHELKVYCINKKEGCPWIGGYGKIDEHINIGKNDGECKFLIVEYSVSKKCTNKVYRKDLADHESNHCKYRQVHCMYCGFVSTYQVVMNSHANKCTKCPVLCPNKCSNQTYPRDELDTHLASCPEQEVDCTFSEMGCKEKMKHQHLQHHLETNLLRHQLIMSESFKEMKKEKQELEIKLKEEKKEKQKLEIKLNEVLKLSSQQSNQITSLTFMAITNKPSQSAYFSKMAGFANLHSVVPLILKACFQIKTYRSTNHCTAVSYQSHMFYSHPNGYELQLSAEVLCSCSICTKQEKRATGKSQYTHAEIVLTTKAQSVKSKKESYYDAITVPPQRYVKSNSLLVNMYILKGDHDPQLKWSFVEKVIITAYQEKENDCYMTENTFQGKRNYTSNGSKLQINSLPDKTYVDDFLSPQIQGSSPNQKHLPSFQTPPQPPQCVAADDAQSDVVVSQKVSAQQSEEGLIFPLSLNNVYQACDPSSNSPSLLRKFDTYDKTVYFEVAFSP